MAHGLSQVLSSSATAPSWSDLKPYAIAAATAWFAMELVGRWLGLHRFAAMAIVAGAGALVFGAAGPLLVVAWFGIAAYLLGRSVLEWTGLDVRNAGALTLFLVGAALYATAVGLLAHWPVNYPGLYALGLALPLVLRRRLLADLLRGVLAASRRRTGQGGWLNALIPVAAILHLLVALMPEIGHDALATHLFVPGHLAMRRAWAFDVTTYSWAVMPMLGDWVFSIGYMLAGEQGARLINALFLLANAWLVRELACWAGASERGARWGVLLFLTTPLVLLESSSLYIESVWAAFVVGGSLNLLKFCTGEVRRPGLVLPAGLLLGAGVAAKAISLSILPALFVVLVFSWRRWLERAVLKPLLLGLVAFVVLGGIPYLTAWVLTGNPLFPYFNQVFKSRLWPAVNFEDARWSKGLRWDSIYHATFRSEKFLEARPGASGFHWLLLLPAALVVFCLGRSVRPLLLIFVGVSSIAITFHSIAYLRYIFPALIWVTAAVAVALSQAAEGAGRTRRLPFVVAGIAVALNLVFLKSATYYGQLRLEPLMDATGRAAYLSVNLPIRNAVEFLNQANTKRAPVAFFSSPLAGGLNTDALYASWYNPVFEAQVGAAGTDDALGAVLARNRVEYVVLDPAWAPEALRRRVEQVTQPALRIGDISVRKLKEGYLYATELLRNPDFAEPQGWNFSTPEQAVARGGIAVSVSQPATQKVGVAPGRPYRISVTAQCPEANSLGRMQVNWLDRKARYISSSLEVFECNGQSMTHTMDVVAPRKAAMADVYATGHQEQPIRVSRVSFKE